MIVVGKNPKAIPEIDVVDHFEITRTTKHGIYGDDGAYVQLSQNGLRKLQSKIGDICYLFAGELIGIASKFDLTQTLRLKENARYVKAHVEARRRGINSKFWVHVIQVDQEYFWIPVFPYAALKAL